MGLPLNEPPLDRRALGRTLSWLANASPLEAALRQPAAPRHAARRIGITGPPGAGKSTLLGQLALHRRTCGRLGVLAVDPSSPLSGGAILGDRVRMDELEGVEDLYIRSLGSRRTSDGLADNLPEMLDAMDEFGFSEIMLETVGVGQAEYAARAHVDTLVLVLLPDSGDTVQAMKAGIMELADILVVNKADLAGAHRMAVDIKRIAAVTRHAAEAWIPPVLLAAHARPESIVALSDAIDAHQRWLATTQRRAALLEQRARYRLKRLLEIHAARIMDRYEPAFFTQPLEQQLALTLAALASQRRKA
ncbi:ArgK/MeaB family GTPase [Bordetella sp. 2513F-2]